MPLENFEKVLICVSRREFPTQAAAEGEAIRYVAAGVKRFRTARVQSCRATTWPELRWYVTLEVFKHPIDGGDPDAS